MKCRHAECDKEAEFRVVADFAVLGLSTFLCAEHVAIAKVKGLIQENRDLVEPLKEVEDGSRASRA